MTRYSIWNAPSDLDYYQQLDEPPIEPTEEELEADAEDRLQQAEHADLNSGPVAVTRRIGTGLNSGGIISLGQWPSVWAAKREVKDVARWIPDGARWWSEDRRTLIDQVSI